MRTLKIKNTVYIERTKDFYVQAGLETRPDFIRAIKIRESMGDKLKEECEFCHGAGGWHGDAIDRDGNIEVGVGEWEKCICQI